MGKPDLIKSIRELEDALRYEKELEELDWLWKELSDFSKASKTGCGGCSECKQLILDMTAQYIASKVRAGRIDEVNKMPSPAFIGADGIRLELIAEYKTARLAQTKEAITKRYLGGAEASNIHKELKDKATNEYMDKWFGTPPTKAKK